MTIMIVDILSWISFLVGGFFLLIGSLGMVRLQDFWARLHAASIIDSAGVGLLLLGMILQAGFTLATIKLILIVLFLLITGPTATHAVANAAFVSGSRPQDMIEDQSAEMSAAPKKKNPSSRKKKSRNKTRKAG